jgi:hypothetical protein
VQASGRSQAWLRGYHRHIDAMETDEYMVMFAEDVRMVFANADPIAA